MSVWTVRAAGAVRSVRVAAGGCVRDWVRAVRINLSTALDREPWWAEIGSGFSALACAVSSWLIAAPLEDHPVIGPLARLVGGHALEAIGVAIGLWQVTALLADSWPWRWVVALCMTAWWTIPVLQVFKTGAAAPMLAAACSGWAVVNVASAICLVRRGPDARLRRR